MLFNSRLLLCPLNINASYIFRLCTSHSAMTSVPWLLPLCSLRSTSALLPLSLQQQPFWPSCGTVLARIRARLSPGKCSLLPGRYWPGVARRGAEEWRAPLKGEGDTASPAWHGPHSSSTFSSPTPPHPPPPSPTDSSDTASSDSNFTLYLCRNTPARP